MAGTHRHPPPYPGPVIVPPPPSPTKKITNRGLLCSGAFIGKISRCAPPRGRCGGPWGELGGSQSGCGGPGGGHGSPLRSRSYLALGFLNLRPANLALSPSASSILGGHTRGQWGHVGSVRVTWGGPGLGTAPGRAPEGMWGVGGTKHEDKDSPQGLGTGLGTPHIPLGGHKGGGEMGTHAQGCLGTWRGGHGHLGTPHLIS